MRPECLHLEFRFWPDMTHSPSWPCPGHPDCPKRRAFLNRDHRHKAGDDERISSPDRTLGKHSRRRQPGRMQWTDEGVVLGVRKHGETSVILELMTREHGRHLGLVHGG